jgi:hypothetical protein
MALSSALRDAPRTERPHRKFTSPMTRRPSRAAPSGPLPKMPRRVFTSAAQRPGDCQLFLQRATRFRKHEVTISGQRIADRNFGAIGEIPCSQAAGSCIVERGYWRLRKPERGNGRFHSNPLTIAAIPRKQLGRIAYKNHCEICRSDGSSIRR